MRIDRPDPFIQKLTLGSILLSILALGFQDQEIASRQPDEKIWPVFPHYSFEDIGNLIPEVIIFDPRGHQV